MNKLLSLTISAILLMAVATAVFVSCKKDMREVAFSLHIRNLFLIWIISLKVKTGFGAEETAIVRIQYSRVTPLQSLQRNAMLCLIQTGLEQTVTQ